MLLLSCPYCGEREHTEFRYGGDAGKRRPAHDDMNAKAWHDHVFLFDNPKGPHKEYWQHVHGLPPLADRRARYDDPGHRELPVRPR